ncbi:MAG: hypothetical protein RUDDFDWM_001293 [Candidatus Fervidibacterota bacterium]
MKDEGANDACAPKNMKEHQPDGKQKIHCSDIIRCPASYYLTCPAYATQKACFEVVGKPCCKRNDIRRCVKCWVFIEYHLCNDLPLPNTKQQT